MRPFEGYKRRAVVIVPSDEVFKERCEKREKAEGKEIPDNAVWEMKANFQLPEEGQCFDKVEFVELERDEAQKLVEQYNKEGNANLPPDYKRFRGPDRYADRDRNRGYGGSGGRYDNRDRSYYTDYRQQSGGSRGASYMGYSSSDRQRADRYGDRDRDRSYRDSRSSGGRSYSSGYGSGGGGYHNNYSSSGWGSQGQSSGGWGSQSQSGWGNQGWGAQSGWGSQQGYGSTGQWSGYTQPSQSGSQSWGNQGYYGNWSGYYGSGSQQGSWGSGSGSGGYSGSGGH